MRRCVTLADLTSRFIRCCRQYASTSTKALEAKATFQWGQLSNRALIRLSGPDAASFLQGLITNDMRQFEQFDQTSCYAMVLNNRGRVVNDLIIYRFDDPAGTGRNYILECDATELKSLTNTLIRYRMRKKVDMVSCADSLAVFALFRNVSKSLLDSANDPAGGTAALPTLQLMKSNHAPIAWTLDPRVPAFGGRVVLGRDQAEMDAYFGEYQKSSLEEYDATRYFYGICEGAADSPPDKSLPLESNCDYMNGISFHKGCYIGQELTARTHHVGVVRKRLMPVRADDSKQALNAVAAEAAVVNDAGKSVGKFRSGRGRFGLALLRIEEALASKSLHIDCASAGRIRVHTWKPFWWAHGGLEGEVRGLHTAVQE